MRLRKNMKAAFTKSREEIAEVNAGLENSIAGIRVTRAYTGAEQDVYKRQVLFTDAKESHNKMVRY